MATHPQQKLDSALAKIARQNFTIYKMLVWKRYQRAQHLDVLDRLLMKVIEYIESGGKSGIGRLLINFPPRHGKSQTISRLLPTWFLGRNPNYRTILASYGASLAEQHSRYAQAVVGTQNFQAVFPGVSVARDMRARDEWALAHPNEGGMTAVGVRGAVTGKGGHLIIVDDPVKNRAEAESETLRESTWDWHNSDLRTRAEPGAAIIEVMTRWHKDDLHGRLLTYEPEDWTHVLLPAIAKENDFLGRQPGAALWPARYPVETLKQLERVLGPYPYAGLYDQSPIPSKGGLFKIDNIQFVDYLPTRIERWARGWDLALSEKTAADYTVGLLMGEVFNGDLVVADMRRFQVDWDEVPDKIEKVCLEDGPKIAVAVEAAFYQTKAVKKLLLKPKLHDFNIKGYRPDTDKYTRALPLAARVGERMVYVLKTTWTQQWVDEMCSFPYAANDDIVDASSIAYAALDKSKRTMKVEVSQYA